MLSKGMPETFTTCTGKEFKTFFPPDRIFYKVLRISLIHHQFQYKVGINIDTKKFNPHGECAEGGLYFCHISDLPLYLDYGRCIAEIKILDDSLIYIEPNKYKANKFVIKSIVPFNIIIKQIPTNYSEELIHRMVRTHLHCT